MLFRPGRPGRIAALIFLAVLAPGFSAAFPGGLFRPVSMDPFLDHPAQAIKVRAIGPVLGGISDLAAAALNFEGHTLRVESGNLLIENAEKATLQEILDGETDLHEFQFYEVRNIEGRTVGYLLARENWMDFIALEKSGGLLLSAQDPVEP